MSKIVRPGASINFEVWGDEGPWITLVNGHLRPLNDFKMLGQRLVREGFRVVALDNRGAGLSTVDGPFSLVEMAQDIVAIWDQIGCLASGLLGVSMGGFISLLLAQEVPERLRRLILMSTACRASVLRSDEPGWDHDPEKVLVKLATYFAADFVKRNSLLVRSMAKQMARSAATGDLQRQATMQRDAIRGFDMGSALGAIKIPTLIIHGEEDNIIKPEEGVELARGIPASKLVLMPATGHLILAERPKELLQAVSDFFDHKKQKIS
jgi:pimeloyl-ACP methyl ester carboxylesterase